MAEKKRTKTLQKKEGSSSKSRDMMNLPGFADVLFFHILIRLPVDTLARFRSVSKLWNSALSDPSFIRSQFSHTLAPLVSRTRSNGRHTILFSIFNFRELRSQIYSATIFEQGNDNNNSSNIDGSSSNSSSSNSNIQLGSRSVGLLLKPCTSSSSTAREKTKIKPCCASTRDSARKKTKIKSCCARQKTKIRSSCARVKTKIKSCRTSSCSTATATLQVTIPAASTQVKSMVNTSRFSGVIDSTYISESIQGLVCIAHPPYSGSRVCICNPTTRDCLIVPPPPFPIAAIVNPEIRKITIDPSAHPFNPRQFFSFGFDPVSNQHKILNTCVISNWFPLLHHRPTPEREIMITEHNVFAFRSPLWSSEKDNDHYNKRWRRIKPLQQQPSYIPWCPGICVDGVIYRMGFTSLSILKEVIIAFNLVSEEFHIFDLPDECLGMNPPQDVCDASFMNCDGQLVLFNSSAFDNGVEDLTYWILEKKDEEGEQLHIWLKNRIALPPIPVTWQPNSINRWPDYFNHILSGTLRTTGELIFVPWCLEKPFYVFLYDMKKNRVKRVEICGLPEGTSDVVVSALEHVECLASLAY